MSSSPFMALDKILGFKNRSSLNPSVQLWPSGAVCQLILTAKTRYLMVACYMEVSKGALLSCSGGFPPPFFLTKAVKREIEAFYPKLFGYVFLFLVFKLIFRNGQRVCAVIIEAEQTLEMNAATGQLMNTCEVGEGACFASPLLPHQVPMQSCHYLCVCQPGCLKAVTLCKPSWVPSTKVHVVWFSFLFDPGFASNFKWQKQTFFQKHATR